MLALQLEQIEQLLAHAASSAAEVCGLLIGDPDHIAAIFPGRNIAPEPHSHFLLDAAALLRADAAARARGLEIVGFYHSHPGSAPVPSAQDLADAWPGQLLLIVGGRPGPPRALCAWRADQAGRVAPVPLAIARDTL